MLWDEDFLTACDNSISGNSLATDVPWPIGERDAPLHVLSEDQVWKEKIRRLVHSNTREASKDTTSNILAAPVPATLKAASKQHKTLPIFLTEDLLSSSIVLSHPWIIKPKHARHK
jgi:hypothetical protein